MTTPRLSKSRFIAGRQCALRLWYDIHRRELATPADEAQEAIFDIGHEVGDLARERWPGGILVDGGPREVDAAVAHTRELLADPTVPATYEAAIMHRGVLTRVDVLVRVADNTWDLVEVKSATRVKEPFDTDVALQYWILCGAGIKVRRAGLLVLDRTYVYPGGAYDLEALFRFEDLTAICRSCAGEITENVKTLQAVAAADEPPDIGIGDHCHTPYDCPYWAHCSRDVVFPSNTVGMLPRLHRGHQEAFATRGIETVEEIPSDYPLTAQQERVRQCVMTGAEWASSGLRDALQAVEWPLHFLDFEAAQFPLPRHAGTRPWDAVAFQFSCHQLHKPDAQLVHTEFLATDTADPRRALAEALLAALGQGGSIVVYSSYEKTTIRALAAALPDLKADLIALEDRLMDLLKVIRSHYYHPGFGGSYSIKNVLPTLVPHMSYAGMEVADGQAAGRAWGRMLEAEDDAERQRLDKALRAYCAQDSRAMFELRKALLARP